MAKLHSECVAKYVINGKRIDVDLCWQGNDPEDDKDRFYDFYDKDGQCLNFGDPWHDEGDGVPSEELVKEGFSEWLKEEE